MSIHDFYQSGEVCLESTPPFGVNRVVARATPMHGGGATGDRRRRSGGRGAVQSSIELLVVAEEGFFLFEQV